MILSDKDIRACIDSGKIKVTPMPDLETALQPASLDIRLSSKFRVFKHASTPYIDPRDKSTFENLTTVTDVAEATEEQSLLPHMPAGPRAFVVHPGEFVLGSTVENIELPDDLAVRIDGRSSLGRLGIVIHSTAGHINPGWKGTITLEITNIGMMPVLLHPGMRICQYVFEKMSTPVDRRYGKELGSKYAGQTDPGISKVADDVVTELQHQEVRYNTDMTTAQQYEVEVKVLLGDEDRAADFLAQLAAADPELNQTAESNQLNHYFKDDGDSDKLFEQVKDLLTDDDQQSLRQMLDTYEDFTLRTRDSDGTQILVVKAAKAGSDKDHALIRAEGDYQTAAPSINELDAKLLDAGYTYLSKWSRWRREYKYKDFNVSIDRNAGYGFLAEIELVVDSEDKAQPAKDQILAELKELGFDELSQERVGRMFAFYNEHWPEYYQTDKTFVVE